jgi:hypothetical protein
VEVFGGLNLVFLELVCPSFLCVSRVEYCFCFPLSFFFFFFCVFVCLLLVRDFLVLEGLPCNPFVRQLLRERPAESCINCCSCSSVAGRHCVYCCYCFFRLVIMINRFLCFCSCCYARNMCFVSTVFISVSPLLFSWIPLVAQVYTM